MRTFDIHCGPRVVAQARSHTARHAIVDYLRSLGCRDDEIHSIGGGGVAWRGAVYTAVETPDPTPADTGDGRTD